MKNAILLLLLIVISSAAIAQYPPLAWAKTIEGKDQNNPQCAISVNAVDEQGAIYASGYFRDSLRPDDNLINTYLVGNSNWDSGAFIKYDANGNLIWAKSIVARVGYFYVSDLDIDQNHNIYVLCQGVYTDTIDFDPGANVANEISDGNDFFLAKYDQNGNYLWSKRIDVTNGNNTFSNSPNTITVDNNQNIFIGGRFQNQIDLDPSAATLTITNPGGVNCNCTVGFYAKYDTDGNVIWGFADANNASITSIDINELNGQIVIGGQPGANSQPLKLCNANGTIISSLNYGSIYTKSVKFDTIGNIYFSGYFHSTVDFDWSNNNFIMTTPASYELAGFVGKYNSQGNFQWVVEFDPTLDPSFDANYYNVTIDTDNNPIVAYGETNGNGLRKGFFKISATDGTALWPNSMFNVLVGLNGSDAIPSPIDGSVVFSAGIGFSGNQSLTYDAAPDPNITSNITGKGYWSSMAKYGNCVAAPSSPGAILGNTSLCNSDSVTYTVNPQLGVGTYNWTLPPGWTGSSTSNQITVLPNGTSGSLQVSAENLCGISNASNLQIDFTGSPNVQATASTNQICIGDSIVLEGSGADTYTWNNNVINGEYFSPSTSLAYIVTGNLNGCTNADTITVTVNPLPIVSLNLDVIDTLCNDVGIVALVGGIPVGGNYSGPGVNANSFDAQTQGLGIYQIVYNYTDANNCSNSAIDSIYVDVCTGIDESASNTNWIVYPNPSESEFTIYSNEINNEIWVTDLLGKIIIQKMYNQSSVNLRIVESGVYIVFMKTEQRISQKKITINN